MGWVLVMGGKAHAKAPRITFVPLKVYGIEATKSLVRVVEDIIASLLAAQKDIEIVSPASTAARVPKAKKPSLTLTDIRAIGKETGADYVLWGSISQFGQRISLDLQLLEMARDVPVERYSFTGKNPDDLIARLDEVVEALIARIIPRKIIRDIRIQGNKRIDADAILGKIKSKVGRPLSIATIQEDIRSMYKMGFFKDIVVQQIPVPDGISLVIVVKEKPTIKTLVIKGNENIDTKDIETVIKLKTHEIFDETTLNEDIRKIQTLYTDKGYYHVQIEPKVEPIEKEENWVRLILQIKENPRLFITKILFQGNKSVSDSDLKKVMKTKEKGFFWWITGSGTYKKEQVRDDISRISHFYAMQGFARHRVGEPEVKVKKDHLVITITIDEGPQFFVGNIRIQGDLIGPVSDVMKDSLLGSGDIFNRIKVREEIERIKEFYANEGFAFADADVDTQFDVKHRRVDLSLTINKGKKVTVEEIVIRGNTRTRDKVIRRELLLQEGQLYKSTPIKKSIRRLNNTGYFKKVDIKKEKGSTPDKLRLGVYVEEKSTGFFSIGAGYSSVDNIIGLGEIAERNFMGYGWTISLKGEISGKRQNIRLSFIEPYFLDTQMKLGVSLFNEEREFENYTKKGKGGSLLASYPIAEDVRFRGIYRYEETELLDINPSFEETLMRLFGENFDSGITSSITVGVNRDKRDNIFIPLEGMLTDLSVELAGIGGDFFFVKYILDHSFYYRLPFAGSIHLRGLFGYAQGYNGKEVPVFELFRIGGINTLRGFEAFEVGPKDPATGDTIGGDLEVVFNLEWIFPLIPKANLYFLTFLDVGNAYDNFENFGELRASAGAGIRWLSPIGLIKLFWGRVLDPLPGEEKQNFEFSIGATF